jgi:hypothetical protein
MDHCEFAVLVLVMNEVQFLFASCRNPTPVTRARINENGARGPNSVLNFVVAREAVEPVVRKPAAAYPLPWAMWRCLSSGAATCGCATGQN